LEGFQPYARPASKTTEATPLWLLGGFAGYATNLYTTPTVPLPPSDVVGGDLDDPNPVSRTQLGSLFASDTLGFWDDRILVTAGLRWQKLDLKSYDYATTFARATMTRMR